LPFNVPAPAKSLGPASQTQQFEEARAINGGGLKLTAAL
jgi:hypothetical protein